MNVPSVACLASILSSLLAAPAVIAGTVDLREGVRTTFYGGRYTGFPPVGDFYGWAMAFGDIDGDGYVDFLGSSVNAEGPNDTSDHQSDVYVFFGRPMAEIDSLYAVDNMGVADIVIYRGGWTMACDDIDRDGHDDVILSEVVAQSGAYIIFGAPRDELLSTYNFDSASTGYTPPDVHIVGASKLGGDFNIAGSLVSLGLATGDLNNDGYADVVIGDSNFRGPAGGRVRGGAAYIIFGRPRNLMPSIIDVNLSSSSSPHPEVAIYGEAGDAYPIHVAVGDFDGDGIDDLTTCSYRAWGEDNTGPATGEIHGFWGKSMWPTTYDTQVDEFDFAISGKPGDEIGYRITAGDLDGDGRDDLVVGSPFRILEDIDRLRMGEYRVYFGRSRGLWPKWGDAFTMTDVLIIGADTGEVYGGPQEWIVSFSLATGRRDADSFADLLIGASYGKRPDGDRPGKAYMLLGRQRSAWPPFIDLTDGYDTVIYGVDYTGSPGYQFDILGSTVGLADWNNDGLDEMFLAAQFGDGPGNIGQDNGEVYVVFSDDSLATPVPTAPRFATSALLPNYPNPFNPATTLHYRAPLGVPVSLTVFDARGREVACPFETLANSSADGFVRWDASSSDRQPLPSGVYFVKLRAGREVHSRKITLVR